MKVPPEFYEFGKQFRMSTHNRFATSQEVVDDALSCLTEKEHRAIKIFLEELLMSDATSAELKAIWKMVRGRNMMKARYMTEFFQMVCGRIGINAPWSQDNTV